MSDHENQPRPLLVGNPRYPRYAISIEHSPFSQTLYWTGLGGDPWSTDRSEARKWADYGAVMTAIRGMGASGPLGGR